MPLSENKTYPQPLHVSTYGVLPNNETKRKLYFRFKIRCVCPKGNVKIFFEKGGSVRRTL